MERFSATIKHIINMSIIALICGTISVYSSQGTYTSWLYLGKNIKERLVYVGTTTIQFKDEGFCKLMILPDGKIIKLPENKRN